MKLELQLLAELVELMINARRLTCVKRASGMMVCPCFASATCSGEDKAAGMFQVPVCSGKHVGKAMTHALMALFCVANICFKCPSRNPGG